jgi:hypothetical protein
MSFPTIHGPSDPEEFSWEVILAEGAYLESVDDQTAEVYYENGHPAFGIDAEPAHDAVGTTVPTSLEVSEGDVITLVVHHRAGNPTAGAPFTYPILEGQGWEGGYFTEIVKGPPDEQELREERERIAREGSKAPPDSGVTPTPPPACRKHQVRRHNRCVNKRARHHGHRHRAHR